MTGLVLNLVHDYMETESKCHKLTRCFNSSSETKSICTRAMSTRYGVGQVVHYNIITVRVEVSLPVVAPQFAPPEVAVAPSVESKPLHLTLYLLHHGRYLLWS